LKRILSVFICLLFIMCSCDISGKTIDSTVCSSHGVAHQAVFNKKLSDSYFLSEKRVLPVDENIYSHYELASLPDAELLTDNWLVCEDGSVYRLDVGDYFRNDYCNSLYQLHWEELSAGKRLELYATDTVLKTETLSGRILCAVKDGEIVSYMFLENGDYSEYLSLIEKGEELYTCNFYPQIGELHLVKTDKFESNEEIVNSIAKNDDILFIRHQILPDTGYWAMTGLYVFTESGKVHVVYNGEIVQTLENITDISFKYGNSAFVLKDHTVDCDRNSDVESWINVQKILTSEHVENTIGLSCYGKVLCSPENKYAEQIVAWTDIKDIAIMKYNDNFYPVALTLTGTLLATDDNPFAEEISGYTDVSEFCVCVKGTENFALYALCDDGTVLVCK